MHKLLAQAQTWSNLQSVDTEDPTVATIGSIPSLLSNIIRAVVVLSGVVLFIMLIIGGYTYLFSGGDQKKIEKAKGTISNAFLGLVFLVASYLILRLIESFTGITLTEFSFPFPQ